MRNFGLVLSALLIVAGPAAADGSDVAAIKEVITRAYVEGIHREQDPQKIRAGFHPDFVMFVHAKEGIQKVTRDEWIERIVKSKKENLDHGQPEVKHEFSLVEVTGDAAVARTEIHRDGKHTYTDYLSLYRFDDGWRIIGKIFHSHP